MAELTEVVAEVADTIAENSEHVATVSRALSPREMRFTGFGVVVGIVGGCAIGYFLTKRRLENVYDDITKREIAEMRAHYDAKITAAGVAGKPKLNELVDELGYSLNPTIEPKKEFHNAQPIAVVPEMTETKNVFETASQDQEEIWDYANETKKRTKLRPYVIHVDEFRANETEYTQTTLTYYEGDDVLTDEDESQIESVDELVGIENLTRFGYGSNDPNIIYVRNVPRMLEIEIVRSTGSFAEEVHGIVEHSDQPRRRRRLWDG